VPEKPLQPGLLFVGKAMSLPKHLKGSSIGLAPDLRTNIGLGLRTKHYSLLQKFVIYESKKFYNIGPW
jgi:hypothetical protein